ncbi:uncharacterized protein LOC110048814 [Orbicella faveolata]|uniref:uncharacterized protein LOC110048814 n=1 Tax=Orbicella faveolata TaxID=48498 RepID=UPI0009E3F534|nr:uncharacterized protein LOC110048814 [Orbicella faveolata]
MFGVPRNESQSFGESIDENPTERLFEHLCVKRPRLTAGEVKGHLKILKMQDVLDVLAESKEVKDNSPLKALWEDLEIAARVCNLLNKKHTSRIRCWRHLGNKLGVRKDTLDTFSNEGEMISPTEVLIRHLGAARPSLVMADLIWALERIGRTDTFSVVEVYFPDGHMSRFLDSARVYFGYPQQQVTPSPFETEV